MANWGWGSLVDLLKLGVGAALTASGVGAGAGLPMILGSASLGLSGAEGIASDASAPSENDIVAAGLESDRASRAASIASQPRPQRMGQSPMARYAPQNRQPQSGVDPEIMQYLMRYMRPR